LRDAEELGQPVERAEPLVAEVLGRIEPAHLCDVRAHVFRSIERLDRERGRVGEDRRRAHRAEEGLAAEAERGHDPEPGDRARLHGAARRCAGSGRTPGRAKQATALYPPKARELLRTTSAFPRRATFATTSRSHS